MKLQKGESQMSGLYIDGLHLPEEECEPLNIEIYSDGAVFFAKAADDIYEFRAVECFNCGADMREES